MLLKLLMWIVSSEKKEGVYIIVLRMSLFKNLLITVLYIIIIALNLVINWRKVSPTESDLRFNKLCTRYIMYEIHEKVHYEEIDER